MLVSSGDLSAGGHPFSKILKHSESMKCAQWSSAPETHIGKEVRSRYYNNAFPDARHKSDRITARLNKKLAEIGMENSLYCTLVIQRPRMPVRQGKSDIHLLG